MKPFCKFTVTAYQWDSTDNDLFVPYNMLPISVRSIYDVYQTEWLHIFSFMEIYTTRSFFAVVDNYKIVYDCAFNKAGSSVSKALECIEMFSASLLFNDNYYLNIDKKSAEMRRKVNDSIMVKKKDKLEEEFVFLGNTKDRLPADKDIRNWILNGTNNMLKCIHEKLEGKA